MYLPLTQCRACGYTRLVPVFNLGLQPLANDFCLPGEPRAGYAPLDVLCCGQCGLAQLSVTVDPELLYSKYPYITSTSETMRRHFAQLCSDLLAASGRSKPILLEIGSNDGAFIEFAYANGFGKAMGIDPAQNIGANSMQHPTIMGLFDQRTADVARRALMEKPDVILARHVFCHVDNWREFMRVAATLFHDNTVMAIEVPYVGDLLEKNELDSIYHEHLSYLNVDAMGWLLQETGLRIYSVQRYPIHGGAVCLMIRKGEEKLMKYDNFNVFEAWEAFSRRARLNILALQTSVTQMVRDGKKVGAFGASAKATVWLNACGFSRNEIAFVSDNTPHKIGRLVPGTDIPVIDENRLTEMMSADYLILFAWNYADEIMAKWQDFTAKGGNWILPVPEIKIV